MIRLFCYDFRPKNRNEKKRPLLKIRELSKNARNLKKSLHLCPRDPFCQNRPDLSNWVFDSQYDFKIQNTKKVPTLEFKTISENVSFSKKYADLRSEMTFYEKQGKIHNSRKSCQNALKIGLRHVGHIPNLQKKIQNQIPSGLKDIIKFLNQLDYWPSNQSTYGLALKPK